MSDPSSSESETVDINTNPLMEACFAAKSKEEMQFCRHLVTSIQDRSPYAWKVYDSGEAKESLSLKSFKALEEVLKDAEQFEARRRARKKLEFITKTAAAKKKGKGKEIVMPKPVKRLPPRRRGGGLKIREVQAQQEKEEQEVIMGKRGRPLFIDPKGLPPVVCALKADVVGQDEVGGNDVVDDGLGDKEIFVEGEDGGWTRYRVAEDWDQELVYGCHDIPMSPDVSGELNPEEHCFLVIRKGTPPSS